MSQSRVLSLDDGVALAHALVGAVANHEGVRVLFFKGPVANTQGIRPARSSSDVDVLVDPACRETLIEALKPYGWYRREMWVGGHLFPLHAVNLMNDQWPCDIDAHDRYP